MATMDGSFRSHVIYRVPHAVFCAGRTQWVVLSAPIAKNRMGNAHVCTGRRLLHGPTAIGGIANGVRRSTADTLERVTESARTGEPLV